MAKESSASPSGGRTRAGTDDASRPVRRILKRLIHAPAVLSILWPALLLLGGYIAWHRWGAEHVATRFYAIDPKAIEITSPPPHIRCDLVADVFRDTMLHELSLLDRQATARIAAAFSGHPWVRRVAGVRKLPGGAIQVRLHYRHPVAMVRVDDRHPDVGGWPFFAVDEQGVLLPTGDFSPADTDDYIEISIPDVWPTGGFGTRFGDARVEAAASLAGFLIAARDRLIVDAEDPATDVIEITRIAMAGDSRFSSAPQFVVFAGQRRYNWGSPPGTEAPGEATAVMKFRTILSRPGDGTDLRIATAPVSGGR